MARRASLGLCIALVGCFVATTSVSASPVDDKKAQAAQLQREIDANGEQISMLAERYDGAQIRLEDARTKITQVEAELASARSETNRIATTAAKRAAELYMGAGAQSPFGWADVASLNEAGSRSMYAATAADRDGLLLGHLRASREDLRIAESSLELARDKAQREADTLESRRDEIEAANARQLELLDQVQGDIATLIEQEAARRAAAEKAESDARIEQMRLAAAQSASEAAQSPSEAAQSPSSAEVVPDAPPPSSGAAAAVAYAQAQLGKPYQYAATGPDTFDCSGLTMMAWAQAGVSMPHYSAAQGAMFPRVPDDQLSPGDLVIYYPDEHHVAIYVGGGMTIAATQTGDFIKLQPVFRSSFQYAVRPRP